VEVDLLGRVVPIQVFPQGIGLGEFSEELLRALAFSHRRNEKLLSLAVYKGLMNLRLELAKYEDALST
jgi:hypothetical protein